MKWLSIASGFFVLLIAGLSFVLSFHALSVLGAKTQAFAPEMVWIFPVIVDGAIVCFSLAALKATLEKEPARGYVGLVLATTMSSVVFNVLSIEQGVLGKVLAAFPPVLLAVCFDTFLKQLRGGIQRTSGRSTNTPHSRSPSKSSASDGSNPLAPKKAQVRERRQKVAELHSRGMKPAEIAKEMGSSERTVFRDIKG